VSDNDEYVAGRQDYMPFYWKNGVVVHPTSGYLNDKGMGIVVVAKYYSTSLLAEQLIWLKNTNTAAVHKLPAGFAIRFAS
jgi:hypothetical protein